MRKSFTPSARLLGDFFELERVLRILRGNGLGSRALAVIEGLAGVMPPVFELLNLNPYRTSLVEVLLNGRQVIFRASLVTNILWVLLHFDVSY